MSVKKYLNQTDWEFYIERAGDVFWASSSADTYSLYLNKLTGIGFDNQLFYFRDGIVTFYRSKKEMEKVLRILALIIDNEPDKIQYWIKKEKQLEKEFDTIGEMNDYKDIFYNYHQIFLYNTILPYLLVKSFKYVKNKDEELKLILEKIREKSFYQLFVKKYIRPYFKEVAQKLDIDEGLVKRMTMREVYNVLDGQVVNLDKAILLSRDNRYYFYLDKGKKELQFFDGDIDLLIEEVDENIKIIKGTVAFGGKVKGIVRLVNLIEDMDKFEEGDILVTINSNPALMPVIKKASAIVSDEGGSLCHASIMAREFKIPGVVGTKIATKVLKDGDIIEVDADKGIVKKLK